MRGWKGERRREEEEGRAKIKCAWFWDIKYFWHARFYEMATLQQFNKQLMHAPQTYVSVEFSNFSSMEDYVPFIFSISSLFITKLSKTELDKPEHTLCKIDKMDH